MGPTWVWKKKKKSQEKEKEEEKVGRLASKNNWKWGLLYIHIQHITESKYYSSVK